MSTIVKERSNVLNVEVSRRNGVNNDRNVKGNSEALELKRGDLIFVRIPETNGSIQHGDRVALVVSNNANNLHSGVITILPLTSKMTKRPLPTHVLLQVSDTNKLRCTSTVLAEQIAPLSKENVLFKTGGKLTDEEMNKVERAMLIQLGLM